MRWCRSYSQPGHYAQALYVRATQAFEVVERLEQIERRGSAMIDRARRFVA